MQRKLASCKAGAARAAQDPWRLQTYVRRNAFLADINNERAAKNALYRENLASLQRLVLLRFSEDFTVVPRDSAWFAFYDGKKLQGMRDTALYQARAAPPGLPVPRRD